MNPLHDVAAAQWVELARILEAAETARDALAYDVARIPPATPNRQLAIDLYRAMRCCGVMRTQLCELERALRPHPESRRASQNNAARSSVHWLVIDQARRAVAGESVQLPDAWIAGVAALRAARLVAT